MTYTTVLALEFSPVIFERFNWHVPLKIIRSIQIPLVIAGVVLSTLHQSSLGSMLLMMPETLHPLWYSPILPILFLISAIAVGPAMVIFETTLSNRVFGREPEQGVLSGLAKSIPYILGIYLLLKLMELMAAGEIEMIFVAYPQNLLWWAEVLIGIITPIILFSIPDIRKSRQAVFWTSVTVIVGLILNRFNVTLLALDMRPGYSYFPHWMEIAVSVGLVADALLVVWLAHKFLPVMKRQKVTEVEA